MADQTKNYGLVKPVEEDFYDISIFNGNADVVDQTFKEQATAIAAKEALIKNAAVKTGLVDADTLPLSDSAASNGTKRITFANLKAALKVYFDGLYNKYTHPAYTPRAAGLYKVTVDATGHTSAASAVAKTDITALGIPERDTIYTHPNDANTRHVTDAEKVTWNAKAGMVAATTTANGLMAAADKVKLDGIAPQANKTTVANNLTTTAAGSALDAAQGKLLNDRVTEVNNQLTVVATDTIRAYDTARTYPANALVVQDGAIYKSLQDSNTNHPVSDVDWWVQYGSSAPGTEPEQVVNYTMLYNQGDECGEVTGGWTVSRGAQSPVFSKNSDHLYYSLRTVIGEDGRVIPNKFIDYSPYCRLLQLYSGGGTVGEYRCRMYVQDQDGTLLTSYVDIFEKYKNIASFGNAIFTLDISNINSNAIPRYEPSGLRAAIDAYLRLYVTALLKPDDYTTLLRSANITTTYPNSAALVADTTAMSIILSNPQAVRVLVRTCTGDLMAAILQSPAWITAIRANDVAYRIIMRNQHWARFIAVIPSAEPLLNYLMLYDQGDERVTFTDVKESGGIVARNADSITIDTNTSSSNRRMTYTRTPLIDLSDYAQLMQKISTTGAQTNSTSQHILARKTLPTNSNYNINNAVAVEAIEVAIPTIKTADIAGLTDMHYIINICVSITSARPIMQIFNSVLLKPDPYQPWLDAAGITTHYASLDAVLADTGALGALMGKTEAVDYMISCSGTLMAAVCQSQTAMITLVNSLIARQAAMAHPWWRKFILMSDVAVAALDSVAKTVPTMTSNMSPNGLCFSNKTVQGNEYKAFDNINSTRSELHKDLTNGYPSRLCYDFTSPIVPYAFEGHATHAWDSTGSGTFLVKLQGSNDKNIWYDISNERIWADVGLRDSDYDGRVTSEIVYCNNAYRYLALAITGGTADKSAYLGYCYVFKLQFYGLEEVPNA